MKIPILKKVSTFFNEIISVYSDHMDTFLGETWSFLC